MDNYNNKKLRLDNQKKEKVLVRERLASDTRMKSYIEAALLREEKKHKGKRRNKCYFKFGLYANANNRAEHRHEAEGMTIFTDYMAMAETEEKLEALLLKDR